jgi:hypothetical protein
MSKKITIPKDVQEDLKKQFMVKIGTLLDSRSHCGRFFLYFKNTISNINFVIKTIENITEEELKTFQDILDYSKQFFQDKKPALAFYNNFYTGKISFSMRSFDNVIYALFAIQKRYLENSFKANYTKLDIQENSSEKLIKEKKEFSDFIRTTTDGSYFVLSKSIDTIQTSMQNEFYSFHSNIKKSGVAWRKINEYKEE